MVSPKLLQNKAILHFTCSAPFCQLVYLLSIQITVNLKVYCKYESFKHLKAWVTFPLNILNKMCMLWLTKPITHSVTASISKKYTRKKLILEATYIIYAKYQSFHPSAVSSKAHCSVCFCGAQYILEDCSSGLFLFWSFFNIL